MPFVIRQEETRNFPVRYWRRPGGFVLQRDFASRWSCKEDAEIEVEQQHLGYAPISIIEVEK